MPKLAIIPARGGSKRIPRKNIKLFLGKPIIAYSIETAIATNIFDEVMVSTDDNEIAQIAQQYGAKVPFFRSDQNANDHSVLSDVVKEVVDSYKAINREFDEICLVLPTAPFVDREIILKAYEKLHLGNYDTVFPILEYSFPIQRSLKIDEDKIEMVHPEYLNTRSQDLQPMYHDSGQFYWVKTSSFLAQNKILTNNSAGVVTSQLNAQDIDNEIDWKLAELKYKLKCSD